MLSGRSPAMICATHRGFGSSWYFTNQRPATQRCSWTMRGRMILGENGIGLTAIKLVALTMLGATRRDAAADMRRERREVMCASQSRMAAN
jgi:hypothetical protein